MSITAADFKTRFPEFVTETDARVNAMIARAVLRLNAGLWDNWYDEGLYYLSAHFLALANAAAAGSGGAAPAGALTSKSVGDVSLSFASPSSGSSTTSEGYYTSTSYGLEFWSMALVVGTQLGAVVWTDA